MRSDRGSRKGRQDDDRVEDTLWEDLRIVIGLADAT